jgi:hypothetical protein
LHAGTSPQERAAVIARIEGVLRDLGVAAAGVLTTAGGQARTETRLDCRQCLEGLLRELVPPTVGVMTAWPGPAVWVQVDPTLLQVALHQAIRCLLIPDRPVERLSVVLERDAGLRLTLQQILPGRGDGTALGDALALNLAQLAVRRLGGRLACQDGHLGRRLEITLPLAEADPA